MMNTFLRIVVLLGSFVCGFDCYAQQSEWDYLARWQIRTTGGIHQPYHNLSEKSMASQFLFSGGVSDKYIAPMNVSYFFKEKWGVDVSMALVIAADGKRYNLESQIERQYANQYYLKNLKIVRDESPKILFNVGAVYRIEKDRYFLMPRLGVSMLSLDVSPVTFTLKERNTNTYLQKEYRSKNFNRTHVGANLALMGGWKIIRRLSVVAEVSGSWHSLHSSVVETSENWYTLERSQLTHDFNVPYGGLNLGIGLMFTLNGNRPSTWQNAM
jgi:hypothetical protein